MKVEEVFVWSHAIADACMKTTIKPEDVEKACAAYVAAMKSKQTNHQKYFGSPEKAAKQMETDYANVAFFEWRAKLTKEQKEGKSLQQLFVEWLKQEAD